MPFIPYKVTLSQFTNPNGKRVAQVFVGGMPITRELDDPEQARATAEQEYAEHRGRKQLLTWDGDAGVETLVSEAVA